MKNILTVLKAIGWTLRGLWYVLVVATPVLGFWLASSLAAYLNGPLWAAALTGVLAFPLLPLLWELWGHRRHLKKVEQHKANDEEVRERILTVGDRVILRTLAVNLVFLGFLAGLFPQASFAALSTRGDWMLADNSEPWAEQTRDVLFDAAGGLEWLYNSTRDNPYEKWAEDEEGGDEVPVPVAGEVDRAKESSKDSEEPGKAGEVDKKADDADEANDAVADTSKESSKDDAPDKEPIPAKSEGPPAWPMPAKLHPAVANMPQSQETSPQAVARYIAAQESDPYLRVKALYDYAADRIRYDAPALARGDYPPQDAKTVFETRKAVCAGYAKLLIEMAETIGINMVYVTGVSRDRDGNVGGSGHAWNAVEIEGRWFLIDVTWGAGYVEEDKFTKRYSTEYLFTPPEVMGVDHFPDKEKWQLRKDPISRGEFMRQPSLSAAFFQRGFELIDPRRSQISVDDVASMTLRRPPGQHLIASLYSREGGTKTRCKIRGRGTTEVRCDIERPGTYDVRLFANDTKVGRYEFIGKIQANSR